MIARITIPVEVAFADLGLSRGPSGLRFSWAPLDAICAASGLDAALLRESDEGNVAGLIVAWYDEHRQRGGAPDAVADEMIAEALLEAERGHGFSHPPGSA
jgi:hypothetical protein